MATDPDFAEYACEQLQGAGRVRSRKMFGEYMIYLNDKPLFLVCDNTVYVRKHECLSALMEGAEVGMPYRGAKEHYIVDIDNAEFCRRVAGMVEPFLKVPPKKGRAR